MAEQQKKLAHARKTKKPALTTKEFVALVNKKGEERNGNSTKSAIRRRRIH